MKKTVLFLIVCTLLMFAVAAPALADPADEFWAFDPYEPAPGLLHLDPSEGFIELVDEIPPDSPVIFGWSWRALNRGLVTPVPDIFREELSVTGPYPETTVWGHCDQSDCQDYWSEPFRWMNAVRGSDPSWLVLPNHPKAAAGLWARNWWVPCGTLPAGMYTVKYRDILTRTIADPWTWPGPVQYPPWDTGVLEYTFWVGPPVL
jgi:hypothetical protein